MLAFLLSVADLSDREKVRYIYDSFHAEMIIFAEKRLTLAGAKDPDTDVYDVVQNAFFKITKYIKNIDFSLDKKLLRAYVLTVVENEISNFLKSEKRFDTVELQKSAVSDNEFFEHIRIKDTFDTVVREMKKLDEKYSITMLYRYYNGMSVKSIAELMGVSPKTVYTRLERGKLLLMEALKKYEL